MSIPLRLACVDFGCPPQILQPPLKFQNYKYETLLRLLTFYKCECDCVGFFFLSISVLQMIGEWFIQTVCSTDPKYIQAKDKRYRK